MTGVLPGASSERLPKIVIVMSVSAALVAANIHYNQPLLPLVAQDLGVDPGLLGLFPAMTQIGFALSLLFVLPLADSLSPRRVILAAVCVVVPALVAQAIVPNLPLLLVAAVFVGAASVAPQIFAPFAATVAPSSRAGQASGMVLAGILLGVLLSKLIAGFIGAWVGWRWVYVSAAAMMLVLLLVLWRTLPDRPSGPAPRFSALIASPVVLLRAHPSLRLNSWLGALGSAAFALFWSTYALQYLNEFGFGADIAGLFAIAGIAGTLLAPLAGRSVDRGRTISSLVVGSALIVVGFVVMWFGRADVIACIVSILVLDGGIGIAHSSNQAQVLRIDPSIRGRLNSVYMFVYFLGAAGGSMIGAAMYTAFGWLGVCAAGLAIGVLMLATIALGRADIRVVAPEPGPPPIVGPIAD